MTKTRRDFTPEFKREAVALLESSGRPLMQIATELGISPSMLRNWRVAVNGGAPRSSAGTRAPSPSASPMTSPADQAAEIARLRRELDRTRMERDVLKKPSASSRRCPNEVSLHRAACPHLPGATHVPRAPGLAQRLLCLAVPARERQGHGQSKPPPGCLAPPCSSLGPLWQPAHTRSFARRGASGQPRPGRAADAPAWHSRPGPPPLSAHYDRQSSSAADCAKPAAAEVYSIGAQPCVVGRH